MNILVIGEEENFNECCTKFGSQHIYAWEKQSDNLVKKIESNYLIFDFQLHRNKERFAVYRDHQATVFVETSCLNLSAFTQLFGSPAAKSTLFGFCGMPTLLNRSILEVCLLQKGDATLLADVCSSLATDYRVVQDRAGMVTPRVVCMIINEAYYALEEGVASIEDIDKAMKLGTNYPLGPFEWCEKIGARKVCDVLNAVYRETNDERYKVCALLTSESLK